MPHREPTSTEFCDVARYQFFSSEATVDWLAANDRDLLTGIVTHNEKLDEFCYRRVRN